ncbi:MAG: efflux RND transporter permease subunit, partial [FCB group bacterium]|nr:efflux RND transporter permease subunit [FCB group bacterium]
MKISEKAIQQPVPVLFAIAGIFVASILSYITLPLELVPKIEVPYAFVSATYVGAAPDEIESDVIKPIEERLAKLTDLDEVTSYAMQNMAFISVKFAPEADLDKSMDDLREKVNESLSDLPAEVKDVSVRELEFTDLPISILNIYGDYTSQELREIGKQFKDKLIRVPGVNSIELFGGLEPEITVKVDPDLLLANHLSIGQVIQALRTSNINLPGGVLKLDGQDIPVRTIGKFQTLEDIADAVVGVSKNGTAIRLRDVAKVINGHEEPKSFSRYNDYNSVTLLITKKTGSHIVATTEAVEREVEELARTMPEGIKYAYTARQATDIARQSRQLNINAAWGIVFVVLILFFGIGFRNSLIVSMALPFSLMSAFLFMYLFGVDRTGIAMFALIMVLGIVVDGAIIVAESTYRHMEEGLGRKEAAIAAMREIGIPIMTAVLTTMVAFAPIMFMKGIMGQFLSVIPKVVIFALMGVFIADHFLIPVVASRFMRRSKNTGMLSGEWWGKRQYVRILKWALRHRWQVLTSVFCILILALTAVGISILTDTKLVRIQAFPKVPKPRIVIDISTDPGSQLEYTDQITREIESYIKTLPEVDRYVSTVGESGVQNVRLAQGGGVGAEIAQINVDLVEDEKRDRTVDEVISELESRWGRIPGVDITFGTIEEGPPVATNVEVDIYGDDLEAMERLSELIKKKMETIPGATNVRTSQGIRRTEFQVRVDHDRAANYGLSSEEISNTVASALFGIEATQFSTGLDDIPVRVKLNVNGADALDAIRNLNIPNRLGQMIPFANVATLKLASGQTVIRHRNFKRNVNVTCDLNAGVDASDIRRKIDPFIAALTIPAGINIEYGGAEDEAAKSFRSLGQAMVIGFFIIIFILAAQFRSLRQPLIIAVTIPLSFIGVIFGLIVTRVPFGLMAFFGVVALMGVVVNDAIVLISYVNDLRRDGMPLHDALIKGGRNRLRPIILT